MQGENANRLIGSPSCRHRNAFLRTLKLSSSKYDNGIGSDPGEHTFECENEVKTVGGNPVGNKSGDALGCEGKRVSLSLALVALVRKVRAMPSEGSANIQNLHWV